MMPGNNELKTQNTNDIKMENTSTEQKDCCKKVYKHDDIPLVKANMGGLGTSVDKMDPNSTIDPRPQQTSQTSSMNGKDNSNFKKRVENDTEENSLSDIEGKCVILIIWHTKYSKE